MDVDLINLDDNASIQELVKFANWHRINSILDANLQFTFKYFCVCLFCFVHSYFVIYDASPVMLSVFYLSLDYGGDLYLYYERRVVYSTGLAWFKSRGAVCLSVLSSCLFATTIGCTDDEVQ